MSILKFMEDGSVETSTGKLIFVSTQRFLSMANDRSVCFICGHSRTNSAFNDEHILPDWLLRDHKLHDRTLLLPNGTTIKYGQYTIACCKACNDRMSVEFEDPLSKLMRSGFDAVHAHLQTAEGSRQVYSWLALIILKTHLKDTGLRAVRDKREGDLSTIAQNYEMTSLHHIYCLARSFYAESEWSEGVIGSIRAFRCIREDTPEVEFDFSDLTEAASMLLRIGEVAFVALFEDGGAAESIAGKDLDRIDGPVSPFQLREILARYSSIPPILEESAQFGTAFSENGKHRIFSKLPDIWKTGRDEHNILARLILYLCHEGIVRSPNRKTIEKAIWDKRFSFVFDNDRRFLDHTKAKIIE